MRSKNGPRSIDGGRGGGEEDNSNGMGGPEKKLGSGADFVRWTDMCEVRADCNSQKIKIKNKNCV